MLLSLVLVSLTVKQDDNGQLCLTRCLAIGTFLFYPRRSCGLRAHEALVDGVFLDHRCILTADIHESLGGCFIKPKDRSGEKQIWALAQRHSHRLAGLDPEFPGGDRLCQDNAGALIPIASDSRGNQPDIIFSRLTLRAASQERYALFTSTWKISLLI